MSIHVDEHSHTERERPARPAEPKSEPRQQQKIDPPGEAPPADRYEARTAQGPDLGGNGAAVPPETADERAARVHINQVDADLASGGNGASANCGPASLAMALDSVGLAPAGATPETPANERVDLARISMVGADTSRDGVDETGARAEAETEGPAAYTTLDEVETGATAAGASAAQIEPPTTEAIATAIEGGAAVVVSGTFAGKDPLPWTDDRNPRRAGQAPGGATDHVIAVTGWEPGEDGGTFIVNDPARTGPMRVSADTLESFMAGKEGAVAISRPPPPPSTLFPHNIPV